VAKRKNAERNPRWLESLWDRKRRDTAKRVEGAVRHLAAKGNPVTLQAIRDTVKALFKVSISTNTIQRNEMAYEIYQKHSTTRRTAKGGSVSLARLQRSTPVSQRAAFRAKINRLRRESKDALIFRIIGLEEQVQGQARRENNLREEILRLNLGKDQPRK
jgi:hypothetical protein